MATFHASREPQAVSSPILVLRVHSLRLDLIEIFSQATNPGFFGVWL